VNVQITDSSDTALEGAELVSIGLLSSTVRNFNQVVAIGFDSPATTSATTYKGRFSANTGATITIKNDRATGQIYAIEVAA